MRVGVSLTISEDAQIAVDMLAEVAGQLKSAMTARLKVLLPEVAPLLRCALAPSGSRERALLVRLGWELRKPVGDHLLPAMVAIEMVQFSTLVIDDWLDGSSQRGGLPSVASEFGSAAAAVSGELLSASAIQALLDVPVQETSGSEALIGCVRVLEEARIHVYEGQWLDLSYEQTDCITEQQYFEMIALTTGRLTEAALLLGAILRGADRYEVEILSRFGRLFGTALQLRNDLCDLIGSPELIGRNVGEDLLRGKKRLPWIHAMTVGPENLRESIRRVFGKGSASNGEIASAVAALRAAGSIDYCMKHLSRLRDEGLEALDAIPDVPAKRALRGLMDIVAHSW